MTIFIFESLIMIGASYLLTIFIFDLLLRGFSPFIPSRPWVVDQIIKELELKGDNLTFLAFSSGRSGFFHVLGKKYPQAKLIGVEPSIFPFVVAKVQAIIRHSRIKIIHQQVHRVNVKEADLIYSHLYPDKMRGLGKKLKFECRPETKIISTGFNIAFLEPEKIIDLPDRKGRLDWLSKNQNIFKSKQTKFRKQKKAYFYEI